MKIASEPGEAWNLKPVIIHEVHEGTRRKSAKPETVIIHENSKALIHEGYEVTRKKSSKPETGIYSLLKLQ